MSPSETSTLGKSCSTTCLCYVPMRCRPITTITKLEISSNNAQPSEQAPLRDDEATLFEEGMCGFYSTESRGISNQPDALRLIIDICTASNRGLVILGVYSSGSPLTADYKLNMREGLCEEFTQSLNPSMSSPKMYAYHRVVTTVSSCTVLPSQADPKRSKRTQRHRIYR